MEKGYKFRIYPNSEQRVQMDKTFGCARFVFNRFFAESQERYKATGKHFGYNAMSKELTLLKAELDWLCEPDSVALQSALENLDNAYKRFFNKLSGFPRFKSKRDSYQSYTTKLTNGNIELFDKHIKLPKLGLVRCKVSKTLEGRILRVKISKTASGKYFVSICCTGVAIKPLKPTGAVAGIDLGLSAIAVTSDNVTYPNHQFLKNSARKLAREQRRLSRKQKGSANYEKQRIKVARVHERIYNQRLDSIHRMTTGLVRDYDIICIEDLAVRNMVKNRRLSKAISDAAWGEIERQLLYKAEWYGKTVVQVGRFYPSSQLCDCGYKNPLVKDLRVRFWGCPQCGKQHDRDKNAADNILNEGLRILNAA